LLGEIGDQMLEERLAIIVELLVERLDSFATVEHH
jgi:hypothetical protein